MKLDTQSILKQFEPIEAAYIQITRATISDMGMAWIEETLARRFYTICVSCIERISGSNSEYVKLAKESISDRRDQHVSNCNGLYGVVLGLKTDVENGYVTSLRELIHADLFSDLLESAEYLLGGGYKDAAAVMTGGVLEEHLRKLCQKHGIPIETPDKKDASKMVPQNSSTLNADLYKAGVYPNLDQSSVTTSLALRNKAAHGQHGEYDKAQVAVFLQTVRNFVGKYPA